MRERFNVFEVLSLDEERVDNFHDFFTIYVLQPLFTNEHRASPIRVTDLDVRSVTNPSGKYHRDLKEFADIVSSEQGNKKYEEALFKVLYTPTTFQKMMQIVRKINEEYFAMTEEKHKKNIWNIVFYSQTIFN